MKQTKRALLLIAILILLCIAGVVTALMNGFVPTSLDVFILFLIIVAAIYAFVTHLKQHKDVQSGFPLEDEMSTRIKYKAGYYAFMASLYMWLIIFLLKGWFPDVETMLGGGILMSAVLSIAIRSYLTRHYHEAKD